MMNLKLFRKLSCNSIRNLHITCINDQRNFINIYVNRHFTIYKSPMCGKQKNYVPSFLTCRYMAGHAKWQNVKHIKAEKDRQKSLMCNKYIRMITAAVREKGPDPKANIRLAHLLDEARRNNIPNSTLENALKKSSSKKLQAGTIEMLGPGGVFVVMEYETDNLCEMRRQVKIICRKYSAGIYPGNGGRWRSAYEQKGIIKVINQLNGEPFDSEKMLDAAIEAGAEDVQKMEEDKKVFYEFFCAPDDLNLVKKELEQKFTIEEAFVGYLPMCTVSLNDEDKSIALNFLNELGDLPDVIRMYENLE